MASTGPAKSAANAVLQAVAKGTLVRPARCELCDTAVECYGHHHRGYDFPLDVWWICSPCNRALRDKHDGSLNREQARELIVASRGSEAVTAAQANGSALRDRIKDFRRVRAADILPNPKNWRTHPKEQQDALRAVLAEVGIADALLVRETPQGLQLIDGHLRRDTDPGAEWPVLVLDVSESEADKILATLDPLAAMAQADAVKLDALLREVTTGSESLMQMLSDLAADTGVVPPDFQPVGIDEQGRLDEKAKVTCPECHAEFVPK